MRALPTGSVTLVFTDIEGSTRLLGELGPKDYGAALEAHRRQVRTTVTRHRGVEIDTQGDAFLLVFGDASDALAAALTLRDVFVDGPIRLRIGVHTGTPRISGRGYVGQDVHLGARIAAAGHGGQVLLSRETRDAAGVEATDLGEHRLKDFARPIWLYQLGNDRFPPLKTISNTNLPRPASSFVGRAREVAEIERLLIEQTRLVTLTGPGGSGKTRLAIEVAAELVPNFRNGVFWFDLSPLRDPALVMETVGAKLGAQGPLAEHIAERQMLLVLDNLEQIADVARDLSALLEACPNLRLLNTSRELLRIRGEVGCPCPRLVP